ncbi:MAG TPA: filamentous hemagglutinin family protein [Steroidobacteraceae bacterium]|jgi:filamentous hemagglutinin family protein
MVLKRVTIAGRDSVANPNMKLFSVAATVAALIAGGRARAATLPVPCAAGACGVTANFVTSGAGTWSQAANKLTVNQTTDSATFNWKSFNVSSDGTVQFVQPGASSVALNRIYQADPSQIFGTITANGQVYLINQNGILFGPTAQVNVGGLLASTLDLAPLAIQSGLTAPFNQQGKPAVIPFLAQDGVTAVPSGSVTVQAGATIQTPETGTILIFAPTISNEGTLHAPGGQVLLAAGSPIYLATNNDANLRGLLVEVGTGGTVTNGNAANASATSPDKLAGQIISEHGNVTLAGMAVNQFGRVSATTTVRENGSIRLQATQNGTAVANTSAGGGFILQPGTGGNLTLGPHSVTEVTLETSDTGATVDSVAQPKSNVTMLAANVQIQNDSRVTATSGNIDVTALQEQTSTVGAQDTSDGSRIYVAPNATLDVSGATAELPADANIISAQLRGTEFADFPLQRNGPLRGDTVYFDVRQYGTRADGTPWQGTPLADVSGEIAGITRNVAERNLTGGTVSLKSQGDVIVAQGATINVAGGAIHYDAGTINTTKLVTAAGTRVDIANADPNVLYTGIATTTGTVAHPTWGVTATFPTPTAVGEYQAAYTEGKDAGSVVMLAPKFVLDGTINGSVNRGQYQRKPDTPLNVSGGAQQLLYRQFDQVPLAGTLIVGNSAEAANSLPKLLLGSVSIEPTLVLPSLTAGHFDPATDPLPDSYGASVLRPDLLGPGGIGNLQVLSEDKVSLAAGAVVSVPAGGSVKVVAADVDLLGSIDAPAGTISVLAEQTALPVQDPNALFSVHVGPSSSLTARGAWVNDGLQFNPNGPVDPLLIDGGKISLSARGGNLALDRGSVLDVSGGAQLTGAGKLIAGNAGSITLSATPAVSGSIGSPTLFDLGATLRGYALTNGGSLSLTADSVCIASAECTSGDSTTLWLTPDRFTQGGFSQYSVSSSYGGLTVAPGTGINLYQTNLLAPTDLSRIRGQAQFESLATVTKLADIVRKPAGLALGVNVFNPGDPGVSAANFATLPSLDVGAGASISADPLANLALSSNTRVIVDGSLSAPGGSIALTLAPTLAESEFAPSQAIWLGAQGTLDVSGVGLIVPNDRGLRSGSVLAGGIVTVDAQRGFFEMLPGAVIDVSGASAALDRVTYVGSYVSMVTTPIASSGGSVSLTAAEGMELDGTFRAAGGGGAARDPGGGSLTISLDPSLRSDPHDRSNLNSAFPIVPRTIVLGQNVTPTVVNPGSDIPSGRYGQAFVFADSLNASGFDDISLQAKAISILQAGNFVVVPGAVQFNGAVSLRAADQIQIDAGSLVAGPGAAAVLSAPYVTIGNSDISGTAAPAPVTGTGALAVNSQFLELFGNTSATGFGRISFTSQGDIRLRGLQLGATTGETGSLAVGGELDLTAAQIYPSTLSRFTLSSLDSSDPTKGLIDVEKSGGIPGSVWSAGGSLILSAATVHQGGTLRAPFGSITLEGPQVDGVDSVIDLAPGSLTSTSANGLTIPFGTTQGGFDWTYPLAVGELVFGTDGVTPPAQHVALDGTTVNVEANATIDVSGGGDLLAYEFEPGTGGTVDVLDGLGRKNQFAILPSLNSQVAPFDPNISTNINLAAGSSVYLAGAPGLPAGTYTLLPARYALLPGAFLVTPVSGYTGILANQQYPNPGGGTIVAGYRSVAGTNIGDSQLSGFAVIPQSVYGQQAQYSTTLASQYFVAQAAAADKPVSRLPADSGVLALVASSQLTLNGQLRAVAGKGGLGAAVDIASQNIEVVQDGATASTPGAIALTASSLGQLGAQSLLLGGERSGSNIRTEAQSVVVDSGVDLKGPQILLAATQQIDVTSGAAITASGSAPPSGDFALDGDGAFLAVSTSPVGAVTRTNATAGTGKLNLEAGSRVSAAQGSAYLEGGTVLASGILGLSSGDLAVQSSKISLGTVPDGTTGTILGTDFLSASDLRSLALVSRSSIDFYGALTANTNKLRLDSAGLGGYGQATDAATLNVNGTLELVNSQNAAAPASAAGTGVLALNATDIQFVGGAVATTGFSSVALSAQREILAGADSSSTSSSSTSSASRSTNAQFSTSADLTLNAGRLTTQSGSSLAITAGGKLGITGSGSGGSLDPVTDLGGALQLTGQSVELNTRIDLPAGRVQITSTGDGSNPPSGANSDIVFDSGAVVDVAGMSRTFDGVAVAAPGGTVAVASAGNILLNGGTIDVRAAGAGDAGSISLSATQGSVTDSGFLLGASSAGKGGSFSVDAQSLGNFSGLDQQLNAGGFSGDRAARLRGVGDLLVASGTTDKVTSLQLTADQGSVQLGGTVDVSGATAGSVTLAASGNVAVSGNIDAHSTGVGAAGGRVELMTTAGTVLFNPAATINVSGGPAGTNAAAGLGGTVLARVPQQNVYITDPTTGDVSTDVVWGGSVQGASQTTLEAFKVYTDPAFTQTGLATGLSTNGPVSTNPTAANANNPAHNANNSFYKDAAAFTANGAADVIKGKLGVTDSTFQVVPGIELDFNNGFNLTTAWNLYQWRFDGSASGQSAPGVGLPGILTIRTVGDLNINASISDGFAAAPTTLTNTVAAAYNLPTTATNSWSYRLVGGADLGSANLLAVDKSSGGNVTINASGTASTAVRTGNGFIDIASAGDFTLANQRATVYTAGVAGPGIILTGNNLPGSLKGLAYPTDGGDIRIAAGGNIVGAPSNQLFTSWLWRVGQPDDANRPSAVAWTVSFQNFQQGVAALGGGNVSIGAGGDISDLSASIPSIGVQVGGTKLPQSVVDVTGRGTLSVQAGGSIEGGSYYVGLGSGRIDAGDDVGGNPDTTGLGPILALGDTQMLVQARGNLDVGAIVNPSLLPQASIQQPTGQQSYFATYSPSSSVTVTSSGGNVSMEDMSGALMNTSSSMPWSIGNAPLALSVLPPTVNFTALDGDIHFGGLLSLFPAPKGNLNFLAQDSIIGGTVGGGTAAEIVVSDADAAQLPSVQSPQGTLESFLYLKNLFESAGGGTTVTSGVGPHAVIPVHSDAAQPDGQPDDTPVRLVAATGNIDFSIPAQVGSEAGLVSPKPARVIAGNDILDLALVAQNLRPSDVTVVSAGRDINYPITRNENGAIVPGVGEISLDGPGSLQLTAGRNFNLGTSDGVTTRGNLVNPALPQGGADVTVLAGAPGGPLAPQYDAVIAKYVDSSDTYDKQLVAFVEKALGLTNLSVGDAKKDFHDELSADLQHEFADQVVFAEIVTHGTEAVTSGSKDYTKAFLALTTLFPQANPNLAAGQTNPYQGDIALYFSRIYTLSGGSVSLLAPGGEVNVGLAAPPTSFGLTKEPSELGIVAQGFGDVNALQYADFQVNQSRVFAADGGDILDWSTEGNIDAGRGAKTAISAPPPTITIDQNGRPQVTFPAALTGSGIQTLATTAGVEPGDVALFAPRGVVNANDAGIVAKNLVVGATAVLGASNITVTGTAIGVPVTVTGVGASLAGASSSAASASNAAQNAVGDSARKQESKAPVADSALSWLDVFVIGFGEQNCKLDDQECLKREQPKQ